MKNRLFFIFLLIIITIPAIAQDSIVKLSGGALHNLGPAVNSADDEIVPVVSPDGKTLYFVRVGSPKNVGFTKYPSDQDIWYSTLLPSGKWSVAKNIGAPLNNDQLNAVFSVTPDGNTLLLLGEYQQNGIQKPGVSISNKTKNGWSFPEPLKIKNYYNYNKYAHFYLANNRKILILALQRDGSYGEKDLYVSMYDESKMEWSEPKNLGKTVNTSKNESYPFLASDGITLYFSSNFHKNDENRKDSDIWFTRRLDETWTKWETPVNMGDSVNSEEDDYGYFIPASGDIAYFVSTKNTYGNSDIFSASIPNDKKPQPVLLIYGKVINPKTKDGLASEIYYEDENTKQIIGKASSDSLTGEYKITLKSGKNKKYRLRAVHKDYLPITQHIDASEYDKYDEIERNLEFVPIWPGFTKMKILFGYNSALMLDTIPELDTAYNVLVNNPDLVIEIEGHTDNVGSYDYNMKLSEKRAKSIVDFLASKGIDRKRLSYKGYGYNKPVPGADNDTEDGRQKNRRVELTVFAQ